MRSKACKPPIETSHRSPIEMSLQQTAIGTFEVTLLGLVGLALYRGVALTPPRIALLLLLTHMALSHVRCFEVFAFLVPLAVAKPFGHPAAPLVLADGTDPFRPHRDQKAAEYARR